MNILRLGDCLEVMKGLHDGFVDTIITDPPYGLSFMGKKWDYDVPSVKIWQECLRVLKPGGTLLCFAGSRTQHRMACNVEDAGFILKDCIMWLYGSGFPKATDISKQLDKGHKREVIGKTISGKILRSNGNNERPYQQGKDRIETPITLPATAEAILWNGWKSHGLKPAYEPILVAMKPNEGTYANNALVHGVSGLNIDGGRIPTTDTYSYKKCGGSSFSVGDGIDGTREYPAESNPQGRYPANIILDEEAGAMLDEQTGNRPGCSSPSTAKCESKFRPEQGECQGQGPIYPGNGGASRFFYCAKASKKERNAGCEGLPKGNPPASARSKPAEGRNAPLGEPRTNHHPTVKPLALMEYLCTLTKTPTGGIVLDPFMGSGTTGVACKKLNRTFVGIEKDPAYFEIAKQRINNE